jgi:AAA15 family ATPase/GTPase
MQYINDPGKINIFIGKNNSGKSNILRFIPYSLLKDTYSYNIFVAYQQKFGITPLLRELSQKLPS